MKMLLSFIIYLTLSIHLRQSDSAVPAASTNVSLQLGSPFAKILNVVIHARFYQLPFFMEMEAKRQKRHNFWATVFVCPHDHEKEFAAIVPTISCMSLVNDDADGGMQMDHSYLFVGQLLSGLQKLSANVPWAANKRFEV